MEKQLLKRMPGRRVQNRHGLWHWAKSLLPKHYLLLCVVIAMGTSFHARGQVNNTLRIIQVHTPDPSCDECGNSTNGADCDYKIEVENTTGFSSGDRVLIVQMKGATIETDNASANAGQITDIGNAGNYEFFIIGRIDGNFIFPRGKLKRTYDDAGLIQLVRVSTHTGDYSIDQEIVADAWNPVNGQGGVVAIFVEGTLTLNANINAQGKGYQGITYDTSMKGKDHAGINPANFMVYPSSHIDVTTKGQGVVVDDPNTNGGRAPRANGGGGGIAGDTGGGGGSNYGAGGNGGNRWNELTIAAGGIGGVSMQEYIATNRIYFGGAGGAGYVTNDNASSAANGGGLVVIRAKKIISNGAVIDASGTSPERLVGSDPYDGGGGGGGGGSVAFEIQEFEGDLTVNVSGGNGQDLITNVYHGPGGGGGGGAFLYNLKALPAGITVNADAGSGGVHNDGNGNGSTDGSVGGVVSYFNLVYSDEDSDNDNISDFCDLDTDNDGIMDSDEDGQTGTDPSKDADNDNIPNYKDSDLIVADGRPFVDANGDGINDLFDRDQDGVPDFKDLDSDNDGRPDAIEAGGSADHTGQYGMFPDNNINGLNDAVDPFAPGGQALALPDSDGDGSPDFVDIDSDNDGVSDAFESATSTIATGIDADNDGIDNAFDHHVGGVFNTLVDRDGDSHYDLFDIDSDNDGITDNYETAGIASVNTDTDKDGIVDAFDVDVTNGTDVNKDGIDDRSNPIDTDLDTLFDIHDLDADGDGIVDNIEGQATLGYIAPLGIDTDGDGLDNAYDVTNGGTTIIPSNIDGDLNPDFRDLDSDDDGESDGIEAHDLNQDGVSDITPANADADNDGIDNAFDKTVGNDPTDGGELATDYPDVDDPGDDRDWRQNLPKITLSVDKVILPENSQVATIVVTLSQTTYQAVTIPLTYNGSATIGAGGDYTVATNTNAPTINSIVIPSGQLSGSLTITSIDDSAVEQPETVVVTMGAVQFGKIEGENSKTITISDNDAAGYTVSAISNAVSEVGSTATFNVVLNSAPSSSVILDLGVTADHLTEVSLDAVNSELTFQPGDWSIPQTVTVTGRDDAIVDGDQTYAIVVSIKSTSDTYYQGLASQTISGVNVDDDQAPVAQDDNVDGEGNAYQTNEDVPITIDVVANDTDDKDALNVASVDLDHSQAGIQDAFTNSFGTWTVDNLGKVTLTPLLNSNGVATVQYTVADSEGIVSNVATLTINVVAQNDAPVAKNDSGSTTEDTTTPFTINVVSNDEDVDGNVDAETVDLDPVTNGIQTVMTTAAGDWNVNTSGVVSYKPTANWNGTGASAATLNYTVNDNLGLTSNEGVITIDVTPQPDAPTADDVNYTLNEGTAVKINWDDFNFNSVDGATLDKIVSAVFSDSQSFIFLDMNANVEYDSGTDVVFMNRGAFTDYFIDQNANLTYETGVDTDYAIATPESIATLADLCFYAAPITYSSEDTRFARTYQLQGTDAAIVNVTIGFDVINTPDAPEFPASVVAAVDVPENSTRVFAARINAIDMDAQYNHTYTISGDDAALFTITDVADMGGTIHYLDLVAPQDFEALVSKTFNIVLEVTDPVDNSLKDSQPIAVTITNVNEAPDSQNESVDVTEDVVFNFTSGHFAFNDEDADDNTITNLIVATLPGHGVLFLDAMGTNDPTTAGNTSVSGGFSITAADIADLKYLPGVNETANTSFTFNVNDGELNSAVYTMSVNMIGQNDEPTTDNETNAISENVGSVSHDDGDGTLLSGDNDLDNGTLSVTLIGMDNTGTAVGTYGSLAWFSDGRYTYTLDNANADVNALASGSTLTETYTYTVSDGQGGTATGTLTITINGVNDAPVADDETNSISEGSVSVAHTDGNGSLLDGDTDVDGGALTISLVETDNTGSVAGTYGTLNWLANGTYTYVLDNTNATVNGLGDAQSLTETFTYTVSDGNGGTDNGLLTITINGVNDDPTVTGGETAISVNTPLTTEVFTVTGNDVDGDDLTYAITAGDDENVFTIDGAGKITTDGSLTPGTYTLTITVDDKKGGSATSTVIVRVNANVNPTTDDETNSINEGAVSVIHTDGNGNLLDGDSDADGGSLTISQIGTDNTGTVVGTYGTLAWLSDGTYTYALDNTNENVNGLGVTQTLTETFTYTVLDGQGGTATGDLVITINGVNDDPTVTGGETSISVNTPVSTEVMTVVGNDVDGDNFTYAISAGNTGNVFDIDADGKITVIGVLSAIDYTLTITVDDQNGGIATNTVIVHVGTNENPTADNESNAINEGAVSVAHTDGDGSLLDGDSDADGGTLSISQIGTDNTGTAEGTYGTLTWLSDGTYTYALDNTNADVNGLGSGQSVSDSFTYTVIDGQGGSKTATLTITINGVNDDPTVTGGETTISVNAPVTTEVITVTGNDVDGDNFTYAITAGNIGNVFDIDSNGKITVVAATTPGTYTLTITVDDQKGGTATSTVTVRVNANVNPTTDDETNSINEGAVSVIHTDGNGNLLDGDSDADGGSLTISQIGTDNSGTVIGTYGTLTWLSDGTYTYALDNTNENVNGLGVTQTLTETFTYTVLDGQGGTATGDLVITINGVNDDPTVTGGETSISVNTPVSTEVMTVVGNDVDGDNFTYAISAGNTGNVFDIDADGKITVIGVLSAIDYTLTITVDDQNGGIATNTVIVHVGTNENPTADNESNAINEGAVSVAHTDGDGSLLDGDSDADGGTLSISQIGTDNTGTAEGTYGTLTWLSDGTYTYALDNTNADVNGLGSGQSVSDSFTYTVIDGQGGSKTATLTITINGVNDDPTVTGGETTISVNAPVTTEVITVTGNDVDGDNFTYAITAGNIGNVFDIDSNGKITVVAATTPGTYTLTITVDDQKGGTATSTVTVRVNANVNPTTDDETNSINEGAVSVIHTDGNGNLLDGDSDADGGSLTISQIGTHNSGTVIGTYGTLTWLSDGTYTYALDNTNENVNGLGVTQTLTETFTYTVLDGQGGTATGDLVITINGVNDDPTLKGGETTISVDAPATTLAYTMSGNDVDEDALVYIITNGNTGNVFAIDNDGKITVVGALVEGDYVLTVSLNDGNGGVVMADVTIHVVTNDNDGDGILNEDEDKNGNGVVDPGETDPNDKDSDNDGLEDGVEDANKDGVKDADESDPLAECDPDNTLPNCDFDGDGLPNSEDPDDDGDGVNDGADKDPFDKETDTDGDGIKDKDETTDGSDPLDECSPDNTRPNCDFDGDGLPNSVDPDDDGDGVNDGADKDPFDKETDTDGDGIKDKDETTGGSDPLDECDPDNTRPNCDFDGDGLPNSEDPDDDGDGVNDGADKDPFDKETDTDGDGIKDKDETTDGSDPLDECSPDNTRPNCDFDGDGLPNSEDPDDDGDGVNDGADKDPFDKETDTDGDGVKDKDETTGGSDPLDECDPDNTRPNCDFDGDGLPNSEDPDDDGDGVNDGADKDPFDKETDTDGDGIKDKDETTDGSDPLDECSPDNTRPNCDFDGDGLPNSEDPDDDGDGVNDGADKDPFDKETDTDGDGVKDKDETTGGSDPLDECSPDNTRPNCDFDGDGLPNSEDPDDDGDGVNDGADKDPFDKETDTDGDGVKDKDETSGGSDPIDPCDPSRTSPTCDFDGDGQPNKDDLDDDGDGITDIEEGEGDTDGDGDIDKFDEDTDGDGISDSDEGDVDTDGDGTPDYKDLDSDDDGISDSDEGDMDTDGDGTPDYKDLDSDDDGISDSDEGDMDTDGDGTPDYKDLDSDDDGISDSDEGNIDTDGDGTPDYKDLDSDDDGILDGDESTGDCDDDGVLDRIDPDVCVLDTDGDGILDLEEGTGDTDGDGTPDYKDMDSDNDGILDIDEGNVDTDGDGTPDYKDLDSDADGILDAIEGEGDTDGDFTPDYKDTDSDNDKIDDAYEGEVDTDKDGTPDYIDTDSDNDNIDDLIEGNGDFDKDGTPDFRDEDTDGDQILDVNEGVFDRDNDGQPDFRDADEMEVLEGFSPNNDGINDKFVVVGEYEYDHVSIEIYNRWGNIVYEMDRYDDSWNGESNVGFSIGKQLPVGTYFYIVTIHDTGKKLNGYVYLNR